MKSPVLIIMAAGMGSRYGGLKQMDPVDADGHLIIDFSLYDAKLAGFEDVIFVIKEENEALFRQRIGDRIRRTMNVRYAYQKLDDLPDGFRVPEGRVKPWGTGHAVLSARKLTDGKPFAVINADDYYGKVAFSLLYDFLSGSGTTEPENTPAYPDKEPCHFAMVGYDVGKTVTENGSVARGVCSTSGDGYLTEINERTCIEKRGENAAFTEDGGKTWTELPGNTPVSMNAWGFSPEMMKELEKRFPKFLEEALRDNPLKGEYFLPFVVEELLKEKKADVKVLRTPDRWIGVTYQEDKPSVMKAVKEMEEQGLYRFPA